MSACPTGRILTFSVFCCHRLTADGSGARQLPPHGCFDRAAVSYVMDCSMWPKVERLSMQTKTLRKFEKTNLIFGILL